MKKNDLIIYSILAAVAFIVGLLLMYGVLQSYITAPIFDTGILIWIVIGIVLFFLVREILLWYWKVNKAIELLEKIEKNTRKDK